MRRQGIGGALLALALTGCGPLPGVSVATSAGNARPSPTSARTYLPSVPDSIFSGMGYRFTPATVGEAGSVGTTQAKAEEIAVGSAPFSTARANSSALEHVSNPRTNAPPNGDRLTWVVDISPPGGAVAPGNAPGSSGPVKYWIAWVDASTGEELGYAFHD